MPKAWYEEDDNEPVWWKATKKNAHQACPIYFQQAIRFSENPFVELPLFGANAAYVYKSVGFGRTVLNVIDIGTKAQRGGSFSLAAHSYCAGAFVGGWVDALWQVNHNGTHLMTSAAEQTLEWWEDLSGWYESKEQGVARFLDGLYEWWK